MGTEINNSSRVMSWKETLKYQDKVFSENITFADLSFFEIFSFDIITGKRLKEPRSILLTESIAKKYFGSDDPLWKIVLFADGEPMVVTGIIAPPRLKSWLMDFAYATELRWWIFALSGGIALAIALLTISYQAIKTSLVNPANILKEE